MPFGDIVVNTKTYQPRQPGYYSESTINFGDPINEFRLSGATRDKNGLLRSSVTRLLEKDIDVNGSEVRKQLIVTLSISSPASDFTGTEIDGLAADISEFLTASTVSRLMQGES